MIDLGKKTEDELKVIAYDLLVQLEVTQNNLRIVNSELSKRAVKGQLEAVRKDKEC